jgi:hypothetical protein
LVAEVCAVREPVEGSAQLDALAARLTLAPAEGRVRFFGICWRLLDGDGNLTEAARYRIGHTPLKPIDAAEGMRLARTLVVMVAKKCLRDLEG